MKRRVIIFFLLTIITWNAGAQEKRTWNLKQLIQYSFENSPMIRITKMKIDESTFKTQEIKSKQLPQISGTVGGQTMFIKLKMDIPAAMINQIPSQYLPIIDAIKDIDKLYSLSGGVQLTQVIYNPQLRNGILTAKSAEDLYRLSETQQKEDLIYEIAANYYQILVNFSQLEVIENNYKNLKQAEKSADLLYQNDLGKKTDLNRIKVNIINLGTQKEQLQNGISKQINYLKVLCGIPVNNSLEIDRNELTNIQANPPLSVAAFVPESRTEYKSLQIQKNLEALNQKNIKAGYQPSLAAFGQASYQSYNTKFSFNQWSNNEVIGLSLSIPIFDGGEKRSKIRQSDFKTNQLEEQMKQTINQMESEYRNSINELRTSYNAILSQDANKKLAADIYEQTNLQYKEGMSNLTDLLDAETSLRTTQDAYDQHVLDFKIANLNLLKAQGKLNTIIQ